MKNYLKLKQQVSIKRGFNYPEGLNELDEAIFTIFYLNDEKVFYNEGSESIISLESIIQKLALKDLKPTDVEVFEALDRLEKFQILFYDEETNCFEIDYEKSYIPSWKNVQIERGIDEHFLNNVQADLSLLNQPLSQFDELYVLMSLFFVEYNNWRSDELIQFKNDERFVLDGEETAFIKSIRRGKDKFDFHVKFYSEEHIEPFKRFYWEHHI